MFEALVRDADADSPRALCPARVGAARDVRAWDWRGAFDAAIARLPREANLYDTAMRFSQPKWGGKPGDIELIESLARKNNPSADWVDGLRKRHLPKE